MKKVLQSKVFPICLLSLILLILLICVLRIPTRLFASNFNANTNLPIGLLQNSVDWTGFTPEGGFGMMCFGRETDTGYLGYYYSNWPDAIFGRQRVDYITIRDSAIEIYGISLGDDPHDAEHILLDHGFRRGRNENQYIQWGVIITLRSAQNSGITEMTIAVPSTNILGVVF